MAARGATKISALLTLLTISMMNAATATNDPLYCPPTMTAMAAMEPCRQYLMQEQELGMAVGSPAAPMMIAPLPALRQQCCVQFQGMMPRCQCHAMCQMTQFMQQDLGVFVPAGEQQMMVMRLREMAMRLPYVCGTAPTYCHLFAMDGC